MKPQPFCEQVYIRYDIEYMNKMRPHSTYCTSCQITGNVNGRNVAFLKKANMKYTWRKRWLVSGYSGSQMLPEVLCIKLYNNRRDAICELRCRLK
jgi:hypothetical protein